MSICLLETPYLSITAMARDAALKSANVQLLSLEPIGTEVILSRFSGDAGSVRACQEAATQRVKELGSRVVAATILDAPPDRVPVCLHNFLPARS